MNIIDCGRIRFNFTGPWNAGTTYQLNDVVTYGGHAYCYINVNQTEGNLPSNPTYWTVMVKGFNYQGAWNAAIAYRPGDVVENGGITYIATQENTGQNPTNVSAYWTELANGLRWTGVFSTTTAYEQNDLTRWGGTVYVALSDVPASATTPPNDTVHWQEFASGNDYQGSWDSTLAYKINQTVRYGGTIYLAVADVAANEATPPNNAHWKLYVPGMSFKGAWVSGTAYKANEVVNYGAAAYQASVDIAASAVTPPNNAAWVLLTDGMSPKGAWNNATAYKKSDMVTYGSISYYASNDIAAGQAVPSANANWIAMANGLSLIGAWASNITYKKGDVVSYGGSAYVASTDVASGLAAPSTNATWSILASGIRNRGVWAATTVYIVGDIITINGTTYICKTDHTSGSVFTGNTTNWQVLVASGAIAQAPYGVPAQPPAGNFAILSRKQAGRSFLEIVGDTPADTMRLMPTELEKSIFQLVPGTGASHFVYGGGVTAVGTVTHPAITTTDWRRHINYAGTAGAGARATDAPFLMGNAPGVGGGYFWCRFGTPDFPTYAQSIFVGVGPTTTQTTAALTNAFGVGRLSSDATTDTNLYLHSPTGTRVAIPNYALSTTSILDVFIYWQPSPDTTGGDMWIKVVDVVAGVVLVDSSLSALFPGITMPAGTLLYPRANVYNATASYNSVNIYGMYAEGV